MIDFNKLDHNEDQITAVETVIKDFIEKNPYGNTTNSEIFVRIPIAIRKTLRTSDIGQIRALLQHRNIISYEYIATVRPTAGSSGRFSLWLPDGE